MLGFERTDSLGFYKKKNEDFNGDTIIQIDEIQKKPRAVVEIEIVRGALSSSFSSTNKHFLISVIGSERTDKYRVDTVNLKKPNHQSAGAIRYFLGVELITEITNLELHSSHNGVSIMTKFY